MDLETAKHNLKNGIAFAYTVRCETPKNENDKVELLHKKALEVVEPDFIVADTPLKLTEIRASFPEDKKVIFLEKKSCQTFEDIEDIVEFIHDSKADIVLITNLYGYEPIVQHFVYQDNPAITTIVYE